MEKTKKKNGWAEMIKVVLIAVVIAFLLRSFVLVTSVVEGESMEPTLENGEIVLFNKFTYLFNDPERGDIVIIDRRQKNYVKRVIALPGENVAVDNETLYIDGEEYKQTFITGAIRNNTGEIGPLEVPENSYFVMGDNRQLSKDSRNGLGFISGENITGKSELIIFPLNEWSMTK
ncbi:signal peptidase I [Lentibacillus amyloliquefaciens]|uniref:Signal peptidase I n=1 Tax=Lentibacillus amyloliquefaciens TaxID=1472767 RepID=A0A0U4F3L4_9BACI|nr:signal peptidase I [Lentibacillus amyloliquefaciens]ALX47315.1 S26 family signal peptidase [Lentibacillus amyloliquefaciens]